MSWCLSVERHVEVVAEREGVGGGHAVIRNVAIVEVETSQRAEILIVVGGRGKMGPEVLSRVLELAEKRRNQ